MSTEEKKIYIIWIVLMILNFVGTTLIFNYLWYNYMPLWWLIPWFIFLAIVVVIWGYKSSKKKVD